jgi:hypothetical protein
MPMQKVRPGHLEIHSERKCSTPGDRNDAPDGARREATNIDAGDCGWGSDKALRVVFTGKLVKLNEDNRARMIFSKHRCAKSMLIGKIPLRFARAGLPVPSRLTLVNTDRFLRPIE